MKRALVLIVFATSLGCGRGGIEESAGGAAYENQETPTLTVSGLTFTDQPIGTSVAHPISLTNTHSRLSATLTAVTSQPPFFIGDFVGPVVLRPGESMTVTATFQPASVGELEGLFVCALVESPTQSFRIHGTAVAAITTMDTNPVAYWPLDEGSGATAADVSGHGNIATLRNGARWAPGVLGGAIQLDGVDDDLLVTDAPSLDVGAAFSITAWVRPDAAASDFGAVLAKDTSYHLYASSVGYCGGGAPLGAFHNMVAEQTACQPAALPVSAWSHLALTYDGISLSLFRDGAVVAAPSISGAVRATVGNLLIGASEYGEHFKGLLDDVRVYNRALDPAEIQTLASVTVTQEPQGPSYYVGPDGDDATDCAQAREPSSPKRTVAAGIACLASGDTLSIKAGTYNESISHEQMVGRSGTSYANATTIQAYGTDRVTINGSIGWGSFGGEIRYIVFKGDPTLKNLVLDCATSSQSCVSFGGGENGGAIDHIKFDGVEIKNSAQATAIFVIGGNDGVGTDIWVTNSVIHDQVGACMGNNGYNNDAHGFYVQTSNNIIENTEIYNTAGYGIHQYNEAPSLRMSGNIYRHNHVHHTGLNRTTAGEVMQCNPLTAFGILMTRGDGNQAYDNVVTDSMNGINASGNNLIYNNTVLGNGVGFPDPPCCYAGILVGNGAVVKNNIVFSNAIDGVVDSNGTSIISNNLTIDPKLVNAAAGDFRLRADSPAIDAGTADIADGISVPYNGAAPDIGAFEY